jgi:hypothetical protein
MGLHIGQPDRLLDDLLDTAEVALLAVGAREREAEQLKRDVVEALVMDTTDTMAKAAKRALQNHREEQRGWIPVFFGRRAASI